MCFTLSALPTEIQINILTRLDTLSLSYLSRTCNLYHSIYNDEYTSKNLVSNLMYPISLSSCIEQYNHRNSTNFTGWHDLYIFICRLDVKPLTLTSAVVDGHIDLAKYLSHTKLVIDTDNMLTLACSHRHVHIVEYLLNTYTYNKSILDTMLMKTLSTGKIDVLKCLILHGGDIHIESDAPLRWLCHNDNLGDIKFMVEHGADVTVSDNAPVIIASRKGYLDIVKYLVEHGADIHAQNNYAIKEAAENGHNNVVLYLEQQ